MKWEEVNERLTNIGKNDTIEKVREDITSIISDIQADYTEKEQLESDKTNLTSEVDRLQKHNMQLYLQVTSSKEEEQEDKEEKETEELKFSDLFDEKGGLK